MRNLKQSTATNVMVFMTASADHVTGLAGAALTVTASKNGAAFAGISPTVTDRGNGWYNLALTAPHTDTLGDLALHITAASADPSDLLCRVVAGSLDADVSTRSTLTAPQVRTELTTELARIDVATSTRLADADYTAPDNAGIASIEATVATLPDTTDIANIAIEGSVTLAQSLRLANAVLGGKVSGADTANETFRDLADTKDRIVNTVDASGNRTAITLDLS